MSDNLESKRRARQQDKNKSTTESHILAKFGEEIFDMKSMAYFFLLQSIVKTKTKYKNVNITWKLMSRE